ncbi:unnamed protein product [Lampetra fluviatilis]
MERSGRSSVPRNLAAERLAGCVRFDAQQPAPRCAALAHAAVAPSLPSLRAFPVFECDSDSDVEDKEQRISNFPPPGAHACRLSLARSLSRLPSHFSCYIYGFISGGKRAAAIAVAWPHREGPSDSYAPAVIAPAGRGRLGRAVSGGSRSRWRAGGRGEWVLGTCV